MITRMEIALRSKLPCSVKPESFTIITYTVLVDGDEVMFDFGEMVASTRIENGYLYIDVLQKDIDYFNMASERYADALLQRAKKEDFTEIHYECCEDLAGRHPIELVPLEIVFTDYSTEGSGEPMPVRGVSFSKCR